MTGGIERSHIKENAHHDYFRDGCFLFNCVNTLDEGQMFGELGLLLHTQRTATIMAKENVHLAVLNKKCYEDILMIAESKRLNDKIDFFERHIIKDATRDTIAKFAYAFEKMKLILNQVIYKKGDEIDNFYVVKNGNILVIFIQKNTFLIFHLSY